MRVFISAGWKIEILTCRTSCCGGKTSLFHMDGRSTTCVRYCSASICFSIHANVRCSRFATISLTRGMILHFAHCMNWFWVDGKISIALCRVWMSGTWFKTLCSTCSHRAHQQLSGMIFKVNSNQRRLCYFCFFPQFVQKERSLFDWRHSPWSHCWTSG
jgi:hypothetical protein